MQAFRQLLRVPERLVLLGHSRTSIRHVSFGAQSWSVEQSFKETVSKAASLFEDAISPGGAWSPAKMPDLTGKTFLVTGANSGIGYQAAKQLAQSNAAVTIASRNKSSGERWM